jgi:hypothetical protein
LLTWKELRKLNVSLTNHGLRKEWWLANENKPLAHACRVLAFAISEGQRMPIRGKWEVQLVKKLGVRTNNWQLDFDGDLDTPAVRALLTYCGDTMTGLKIANINTVLRLRSIATLLIPYFAQLTSLRIYGMNQFLLEDRHSNHDSLLSTIANNSHQLSSFRLEDSRGFMPFFRLAAFEKAIAAVLERNGETLTDVSFEQIGLTATTLAPLNPAVLRHLRLEGCDFYKDAVTDVELQGGVVAIVQRLVPHLETLHLNGIWDCTKSHYPRMLSILSSCLHALVTVDLSGWWSAQVDDGCVDVLSTHPSLRHLNINATMKEFEHEYAPGDQPFGEVTTGALVRLAQRCGELRTVAFRRHRHVGPDALQALLDYCPRLQTVDPVRTAVPDAFVREKIRQVRVSGRRVVFTGWNDVM